MSVSAKRNITCLFSGDYVAELYQNAALNSSSPGEIEIVSLTTGANTITPPTGATGVTIVPPSGNTEPLTLKGVTGDTGIDLHPTDPTSLGLNTATTGFVLTVTTTVDSVRFIWS